MTVEEPRRIDCAVDGCDRKRQSRDWCPAHYNQWRSSGEIPSVPFTNAGRFKKYVDVRGQHECWPWLGTVKKNGYGQFWFLGKPDRAHRVSYTLFKGPIPDGMLVRHTCDNKVCVNPNHLLVGTIYDNARDAVERGLYPRGETQGRAKLTERQVTAIRFANAGGETQKSLAQRYGVSTSTISFIMTGHNWVGIGETP